MADEVKTISESVFECEVARRSEDLQAMNKAGVVRGQFGDASWTYKGRQIRFMNPRRRTAGALAPLGGDSLKLAQCFMAATISLRLSIDATTQRLFAFRRLHEFIGSDIGSWSTITRTTLYAYLASLRAKTSNDHTLYTWASAFTQVIAYIEGIRHEVYGVSRTFLPRPLRWKHGLENPTRSLIRRVVTETASKQSKYSPDLHLALGAARSAFRNNTAIEPRPGYDLIRLEALAFPMSLGLRIGEVESLPVNAWGQDDRTGVPFIRAFTEKGALPSARPIPAIWEQVLRESTDYLLEQCAGPRARAREIESHGFNFVHAELQKYRSTNPLTTERRAQLEIAGVPETKAFFIEEITACFEVSEKEFSGDGRFSENIIKLPRIVSAMAVKWLDARVKEWDWRVYSDERTTPATGQTRPYAISVTDIPKHGGFSKSLIAKTWYSKELRQYLIELNRDDVFNRDAPETSSNGRERHQCSWKVLRENMLSRTGGGQCTVIDVDSWVESLRAIYIRQIERHHQELLEDEDGDGPKSGERPIGAATRPLSNNLLVVWENQFVIRSKKKGILPRPVFRADFYNYIACGADKTTVFERLGILDSDGKPFSLSPHMIRHWVTTAMLRSGPSEMLVDLWMGRKPGHVRHYDHRSASERAEVARARYLQPVVPDDFLGRKILVWRESGMSEQDVVELVKSKMRVLHYLPWGACSRELYTSPCTRGLMCVRGFGTDSACESFHIDPSSPDERVAILRLKSKYELMLQGIRPLLPDTREKILEELNNAEPLDQHLQFILDVIRGCKQALSAYEQGKESGRVKPGELVQVAAIEVTSNA